MTNRWIDPESCQTLVVLVESIAAPMLMEHSAAIALELDIDTAMRVPADPVQTASLIRTLVGQAISEMPSGGDLTVTACETPRGVELEMADTGGDIEQRATRLPLAAAALGARLDWQNCPQGGGAVTVTFPPQPGAGRMAA